MLELVRPGPDGPRLVARLGPGEFFGEMGVLLGRPRSVRAVAISDSCLLELDAATFEEMCIARPEIAIRVIQRLAARVIELEQRLAALGVDDVLRPLVRVLVRRADREVGGGKLATTLRRLAGEAGVSLLEAHRALGQLLERRLVRLVDDVLVIPDLEALSACLDGAD
jgi:CRP-like cAMP-binding protein